MSTSTLEANKDTGMEPLNGFYRGRVETNLDPQHLGRIKVRVPQLHGVPNGENSDEIIANEDIPWAFPVAPFGAGSEHGSMIVPETGDYVFVAFENGDRHSPIYFGGCYGIPKEPKQYGNIGSDAASQSMFKGQGWTSGPGVTECPAEVYPGGIDSPNGKVVYKSPKGFLIMTNETDDQEQLIICDNDNQQIIINNPSHDRQSEIILSGKHGQSIQLVSYQDEGDAQILLMSPDQVSRTEIKNDFSTRKIDKITFTIKKDETAVMEAGKAKITNTLDEKIHLEIGPAHIEMTEDKIKIYIGASSIELIPSQIDIKSPKINLN
ncbi:MAG: phage baseplate assembly protein V [Lachnospiraceae bacterium]|nr:phage baseplate assembly protein V [Lachnospiraceae bacterium]